MSGSASTKKAAEKTKSKTKDNQGDLFCTIAGLEEAEAKLTRLQEILLAKTRQLESHWSISTEIARELDLTVLLGIILRRAAELLGARAGFLSLYDEKAGTLIPKYWEGHSDWVGKLGGMLGQGISGSVIKQRQGMVVNDYRTSPYAIPLILDNTSVTSVIAEPLIYGDRIVGVVTVDNEGMPERIFNEEDRNLLSPFAVQAAIAIENARLFDAAKQESAERAKTEAELKKSEELYRTLIETSPDAIIVYDLKGNMITANKEAARLYGVSSVQELLSEVRTIFDVLTEEGRKIALTLSKTTLAKGYSQKNEYVLINQSGGTMQAEVNSSILRGAEGKPRGFISVLRDITERKQAEKITVAQRDLSVALAEAGTLQDALRLCLDAAIKLADFDSGSIYIADSVSGIMKIALIQGVSDAFTKQATQDKFVESRSRFIMKGIPHYVEFEGMEDLPYKEAMLEEGLKSVAFIPIKIQSKIIGGLIVASHAADRIAPYVRNGLEAIAGQIGIAISKAQSENALRESESKFRDLAEKSLVGIFLIQDHMHKYVNAEFARIFGYHVEEIIDRMSIKNIVHEDDIPKVEERASLYASGELQSTRNQFRVRTKNGEIRTVETLSSRTLYQGKPAIIGSLLDVTDRLSAEEELKRLSTAIEQAAEDIVITDQEGVIQYVNPAFERITGYSRAEVLGKKPSILKSGFHDGAFYDNLWKTVRNGNIWQGRIVNRCKDGRLVQEDSTISPLFNATGKLMGYVALKRDVTQSVKMEGRLRQAQKMEAIGTLAGGIAHDFNNMLSAIMGYAELSKVMTIDQKIQPYLEHILKACVRSRDLVQQILTFSRQREQEKKPVFVSPIVKEALKLLRSSIPSTIDIRQNFDVDHDAVFADSTQLHQIIMNLCTNAVHAMRNRPGILEVSLNRQEVSAAHAAYDSDLKEGRYLKIMVRDNGEGIDPAVRDKIFDPFFTTKGHGEGTGLGLSVVYGIVNDHGGTISVESQMGIGTVFTIYLPLIDIGENMTEEKTEFIPKGTGRILYVDDEEPIASMGREWLASLGYDVTLRLSGHDALEAFLVHPEKFDLVITDMTMPNMTGATLAREILKIRPDLPIILTTGFSHQIDEEQAKKIGIREFLMKPVSMTGLAQTVKKIISS